MVTALLCAVAFVLCVLMTLHSLNGAGLAGCSAGSSCDAVLSSRWSLLFGFLPVSGLALAVYTAIAACLAFIAFSKDDELVRGAHLLLHLFCGAVCGAAIWMFILQKWVIGSFCPYCMSAHGTGLLLSAVVLLSGSGLIRSVASSRGKRAAAFCAGLAAAALLAGVQLLTTPDSAYADGEADSSLPVVKPGDAPYIGDPDAETVIELLFDYQCSHCQKIHGMLPEVVEHFGGKVAFVLCPTPLSLECNPYVPRGVEDRFAGSCELARTALALWRISPDAFRRFDAWMFASEPGKKWLLHSVPAAREYAASLVGGEALAEMMEDASIGNALSRNLEIFGRTTNSEISAIPRFISGSRWLVPDTDTVEGLCSLVSSML